VKCPHIGSAAPILVVVWQAVLVLFDSRGSQRAGVGRRDFHDRCVSPAPDVVPLLGFAADRQTLTHHVAS
jgi:hypothetical protein